ncbi:MAG TPA: phage holin family protein [Thermoanaerobaculia bacterium]|nr:phage holin family protein [Thermoanaerobaculia bacterium]
MNSANEEKSIGSIVRGLTEDLSTLFRSEIALAKLELKQTAANLGGAGALFLGALVCGLFGLAMLFVTGILALALIMPAWLATLIVAVIALALAGLLAVMGKGKASSIKLVPEATIASVKGDISTIKSDFSRLKRGRE